MKQVVTRQSMVLGILVHSRHDLEMLLAAGEQVEIKVVGVAVLKEDITPEFARATIKSIKAFGVLRASPEVEVALQDRIH